MCTLFSQNIKKCILFLKIKNINEQMKYNMTSGIVTHPIDYQETRYYLALSVCASAQA